MLVSIVGVTLFVSAFLLFWCQPMVAKMVLPLLGGAAAVWTTCVLFFQVMLLCGYVYAHLVARISRLRNQLLVHGGVMLSVLLFLPIRFAGHPGRAVADHPVAWLLGHLLLAAGVPFFAVSTTAPLLQNWFSRTRVETRNDPYFLYAASNAGGSLISLMAYPLLVEPQLGLTEQSRMWWAGYTILLTMIALVALAVRKHSDDGRGQGLPPTFGQPTPPQGGGTSEVGAFEFGYTNDEQKAPPFVKLAMRPEPQKARNSEVGDMPREHKARSFEVGHMPAEHKARGFEVGHMPAEHKARSFEVGHMPAEHKARGFEVGHMPAEHKARSF